MHTVCDPPSRQSYVECLVAASSGTAKLSQSVGHPIVLVDLVADAAAEIERLRRSQHGSAALCPRSFQPLIPQTGWNDWGIFPLEDILEKDVAAPASGACIESGIIRFPLPPGVTLPEVAEQLRGVLRHLRFQDVVRQPAWLETVSDADPFADILVSPRYTVPDQSSFRGATLCTDLFVFDPTAQVPLLLCSLAAALCAAGDMRGIHWN